MDHDAEACPATVTLMRAASAGATLDAPCAQSHRVDGADARNAASPGTATSGAPLIAAAPCWTERERRIFAALSFDGLKFMQATSEEHFALTAKLRQDGFGRLLPKEQRAGFPWLDALDFSADTVVMLAMTDDGTPLGTLRIQDGRRATLEIESHVSKARQISMEDMPFAQLARMSVVKHVRRHDAMYGLFHTAWRWILRHEINGAILATPPWAQPIYAALMFRQLQPPVRFFHGYGASAAHEVMAINARGLQRLWESAQHPLCDIWFNRIHPNTDLQTTARGRGRFHGS